MYSAITRAIRITVNPMFLDEQSAPDDNYFVWAYKVKIENQGGETVTLKTRHWRITDSMGRLQEVKGPGVVGEQPRIAPGETFQYTSGCMLATARGTMHGTYQMVRDDGSGFDAEIGKFALELPMTLN